jgi:hypothetical protein
LDGFLVYVATKTILNMLSRLNRLYYQQLTLDQRLVSLFRRLKNKSGHPFIGRRKGLHVVFRITRLGQYE